MKRILSAFALCTLSITALAEGTAVGVIQDIHLGPLYGTKVFLKVAGTITSQPACRTNEFHFGFDSDSAVGRSVLATALAARSSQQTVRITGFATCTHWPSIEDLRTISIAD